MNPELIIAAEVLEIVEDCLVYEFYLTSCALERTQIAAKT
jgi:hypothetical protein